METIFMKIIDLISLFIFNLMRLRFVFFPVLTKLEASVVEEISRNCPDINEKLKLQFQQVNLVQRFNDDKKLLFFKVTILGRKQTKPLFDNVDEENMLKKFKVYIDGKSVSSLEVWTVKGSIFSFEFNKPMKQYRNYTGLELKQV